MAFTSRAERSIRFEKSGINIGPGAYNPQDLSKWKPKHGVAPFSSTTERLVETTNEFVTPGPGTYTSLLDTSPLKGKGSSVFNSKSQRLSATFESKEKSQVPGPGYYKEKSQWAAPAKKKKDEEKPKSINWVKVNTAPSIPAANQSHGYEEGPHGELIQQAPPKMGFSGSNTVETAGPGYYSPEIQGIKANSRRTNFTNSKLQRLSTLVPPDVKDRPGPGAYDPYSAPPADEEGPRPSAVFLSSTTREKLSFSKNLDTPGPGSYRTEDKWRKRDNEHAIPVPEHLQAFGSTAKGAFIAAAEQHPVALPGSVNTPGPGHYDAMKGFADGKEKPPPGKAVNQHGAFASTVPRFTEQVTTYKQTPGPGYYSTQNKSLLNDLSQKIVGRYGIFGSTSQRFRPASPKNEQIGPGVYNPKPPESQAEIRRKDPRSAVFASKTTRIADDTTAPKQGKVEPAPPVGLYDVPPPEWTKKTPNVSSKGLFSGAPRWSSGGKSNTPGPGHYDASQKTIEGSVLDQGVLFNGTVRRTNFKGVDRHGYAKASVSQAPRFLMDSEKFRMPGPGSYEAPSGLNKKTFNITIGDNWS